MTFGEIENIFIVIVAWVTCFMAFIGYGLAPFFLNRKFNSKWLYKEDLRYRGQTSGLVPWHFIGRARLYSLAATSEADAQKIYGASREEFKSQLNSFEYLLCKINRYQFPIIAFGIFYCFASGRAHFHIFNWFTIPPWSR